MRADIRSFRMSAPVYPKYNIYSKRFADGTDGEGRFIEEGWIRSDSFVEAVFMLGRYLE